jgi:ABC-type sugar transport system permease subunit
LLESTIGWAPPWFTDQWWAKIAVLLINLWLSYPYFMLICSGALQSIPSDFYDAAQVDGAGAWQRFRLITLPLLLVAVGPLLIASFIFNFNNFNLIYIFNAGGPPMAGTPTPAGHTDILISYVYNLAFSGSRGINYGFAAAITIVIFFIVGTLTLIQFRYTRMWEEIGENV